MCHNVLLNEGSEQSPSCLASLRRPRSRVYCSRSHKANTFHPDKSPHSTSNSPHLYQQNLPISSLQIPTNHRKFQRKSNQTQRSTRTHHKYRTSISSTTNWSNQIS